MVTMAKIKDLLRSKSFWAGIALIASSIAKVLWNMQIDPDSIVAFLMGIGIIGIRQRL